MIKKFLQQPLNLLDPTKAFCYANHDGDTISVHSWGINPFKKTVIRILGIQCPELKNSLKGRKENEPYGLEAKQMTEDYCKGRWVTITRDSQSNQQVDIHNRQLAYISIEDLGIGLELINESLAYCYDYKRKGFDKLQLYKEEESKAKLQKTNIWK